jgi:uncharacterized protein (DUF58 family)
VDAKQVLRDVRRRPVKFIPAKPAVSIFPGEWPSPFEGKGFEPRRFRDFTLGDNPRHVHLPTSARRGAPTIVERVALRDVKIMVVIDLSPSMLVRQKLAIQFAVTALLLYSAWKSETTFGFAVRDGGTLNSFGLGIGSRHFYRLYRQLCRIVLGEGGKRSNGEAITFSGGLPSNAMLVYCSDFLQAGGELIALQALWKTVGRYDFIPVIVQDELEYSFPVMPGGGFIPFVNPETGHREELWISPRRADEIRQFHHDRFETLTSSMNRRGVRSIHLDTANVQEVGKRVDLYFRQRQLR